MIRRAPDPDDRRGVRVSLTAQGGKLARQALHALIVANRVFLEPLNGQQQDSPRVRAQDAAPAPRTQMSWVRARVQRRRSAVTAATDAAVAILPLVACGLQRCKTVRRQVGAARPQSLAMSSGIRPQPWGMMPFAGKAIIPG